MSTDDEDYDMDVREFSASRLAVRPGATDQSMPLVEFARAAEERGIGGLFLNEHTHLPVPHPRSQYPGGGETPARYGRFWDPLVALSFVAATTSLEVGTAVSLVAEHDAIALAKAVASLDALSGGRLTLGVGWGWNREEFEDHGRPANRRAQVVAETVQLMRRFWSEDRPEFRGEYLRLSPSWAWPKPAQRPHPPVLLGAPATERNLARMVEWADGWMASGGPPSPLLRDSFDEELSRARRDWEEAGRDPRAFHVSCIHSQTDRDSIRHALDRAARLRVERVIVSYRDEGRDDALRLLDEAAEALTAGR
jgi:probable F420-dependent oxidoreductase